MTPTTPRRQLAEAAARDGDVLPAGGEGPSLPQRGYRTIALVVACALFMQQLDATVLTIALPTMARSLRVPASELSLALTSYLVALAMLIPASGYMADRWGPRTVFCGAIAVFVLGSIACGQAWDLPSLVVARFVQGCGGAMMVPVGRLVLLRSVSRDDIVAALSWLVMPALIGPILGPPVGGLIVTYLDWRWIFYLNIPIGLLGLVLAMLLIPGADRAEERPSFDWHGFLLAGSALATLIFGFELVSRPIAWPVSAGLVATGVVLAGLYVRHALRTADAIIDLRLLRIPTFRISVAAGFLTRILQGAQPFLLPLMLQLAFGMSAARAGTITLASALGALAVKPIAPAVIRRCGYRMPLLVSAALSSIGYAAGLAFHPGWPTELMFAVLLVSGFFMSLLFTGYNALAFIDVDRSRMNAATSFYATFQQLSLSVGICLAASLLHLLQRLPPSIVGETTPFGIGLFLSAIIAGFALWPLRKLAPGTGRDRGPALSR